MLRASTAPALLGRRRRLSGRPPVVPPDVRQHRQIAPLHPRPLSTDTAAPRVSRLRETWTAPAPRPLHRSRGLPDAPILRRRPRAPLPFHVAHSFHIERIRVNPTRPPGCAEGHPRAPSTSRSTLGGRPPDSNATRQALDALIVGDARISSPRRVGLRGSGASVVSRING